MLRDTRQDIDQIYNWKMSLAPLGLLKWGEDKKINKNNNKV